MARTGATRGVPLLQGSAVAALDNADQRCSDNTVATSAAAYIGTHSGWTAGAAKPLS
jgi:hypothetical protein